MDIKPSRLVGDKGKDERGGRHVNNMRSSGSTTPKCSLASNQSHGNNRERSLYSEQKGEWDSTNLRCSSSATRAGSSSGNGITQKVIGDRVCKYRLHGNCVEADKCRYLHSWFKGHGVFELVELNGHIKNGTIYAWKPKKETNAFELATTLGGDNGAVVSLTVGGGRLYSGSMDNTIRGVCFIISHLVKTENCRSYTKYVDWKTALENQFHRATSASYDCT
ncbi:hypothetical protein AAG906_009003 [Vitis piasezkii]